MSSIELIWVFALSNGFKLLRVQRSTREEVHVDEVAGMLNAC